VEDIKTMCKTIADRYGYPVQSFQLIEECSELIQAVSKYRRQGNSDALRNYIEEIADVEIMLEQIKYLLGIKEDDIEGVKLYKLHRTLINMNKSE
jgi:NTP pyrophosphatase (non-canonical NTP hydrolase)